MTPAQPIAGPIGAGELGPSWQTTEAEGLLRFSSCQIRRSPPALTTTRWLSVRISYWQEGVRSKQRRPTGEESVCVRERRSECVTVRTEWETPAEGARGNFTGVYHCALSRRGEIAFERSMLKQVKKWTVDEASDWRNGRFTNGLLESAVRGRGCAWRERTQEKITWCSGESYQLWRCIVNWEFRNCSDRSVIFF